MEKNTIPVDCFIRDPKTLQAAQVQENTRYIDLATLSDLLNVASGLSEASRMFPEHNALNKIMDINDELISIVKEGVRGVVA